MTATVNYNGVDLTVTGEYQPGYEGKMYMRNGDPGYPGEAASIDDIDILHCGESIYSLLSDEMIDDIETLAIEAIEEVKI